MSRARQAGIAGLLALGFGLGAAMASPPNLVVLMADDLDETTFNRALELGLLPAIDSILRAGGLRFDESFVSNPLCCPSRATFLTGRYSHNHGVLNITWKGEDPSGSFAAFDDREHIGTWLQRAGYRTGLIGKFLNGYGYVPPRNCPACDPMRYVPPGWNDWQVLPDYGEHNGVPGIGYAGAYCMYHYTINDNGNLVSHGGSDADYQTDVIAARAAGFVAGYATDPRPFFLWLAPLAPHFELCLPAASEFERDVRGAPRHLGSLPPSIGLDVYKPSFGEADVGDKPAWYDAHYPPLMPADVDALQRGFRHRLEALRALDDLVARLRTQLQLVRAWSNTVLVLTSDNGWFNGEHRAWGKVLAYEESIRVPLLMRGPGIPAGSRSGALVLNHDLAPTLAALGGATPTFTMDGADLRVLFDGVRPEGWRRRFLVEHFRDGDWAPVSFADYFAVRSGADDAPLLRSRSWIDWRIDGMQHGVEHYALDEDPWQIASIGDRGASAPALRAALAALRECGQPGKLPCQVAESAIEGIFGAGFD
ncbi:sulfatase [Dokdonella sp.]|uniref:sulfatase family protein n=1 Tax=Dokdonella sp. TaxID=2291710 RepID=UPI0025C59882|nr:sulfatase [Dokdonella sp.]MBX3692059.1 sulfatase [Dokdonella sp.]MCW5569302.1 sulfatase [Dokdonella sp.]